MTTTDNNVEKYSVEQIGEVLERKFDEKQAEIIKAKLAPHVVIAGAGSGKTTVMSARVVYQVANGHVKAEEVLGLTFTKLAAGSLQRKVREALNSLLGNKEDDVDFGEPYVATYDSFASKLIRDYGLRIGIEPESAILTDVRRQQLASHVIARTQLPLGSLDLAFSSILSYLLKLDDNLSNFNITIDDYRSFNNRLIESYSGINLKAEAAKVLSVAQRRTVLLDLVEEFRDHKKLSDSLDFSDMTRLSLEVVRQHPSVIDEFRSEFKMVLLDEYQDTSVGQRELMRAIFGDGHAVTAVGDPLQSIYTFRGTSPYNIDSFVNHFPNVDGSPAKLFTLPKTYRNGPNIVALANALSEPLRTPGVHPNVEPLVASELEINGKGDLRISNHERDYDEVQWIAGEMLKANAQGIPFEKMAVLLRRNEDIAWFYRHLTNLGVPSQVTSKQALLNIPEVAELVAYLRCIAEPAANEAWIRILTGARWRIGNRDLALIGKHASRLAAPEHQDSDRSIDDVLAKAVANVDSVDVVAYGDALLDIARNGHAALSASAIARIKVLVKEIDELRRFTGDELTDFVYRVASTTGLLHEVHSHVDRVHSGMNGTIRSLLNMISDFKSIDGSATIFSLLRWFYDSEKYGVQPTLPMVTHAGAVQLMTIHASKGLEFSVVSLPRFAAGIFPTSNNPDRWTGSAHAIAFALRDERINDAILLEYPPLGEDIPTKLKEEFSAAVSAIQDLEERRLAYVAVTRAEKILLASSSYVIEDEEKIRENSEYLNTMHETALTLPVNDAEGHVEVFKWIPSDGIDIALVPPTSGLWPVPMNSPTMQSIREVAAAVSSHPELKESSDSLVQGWDAAIASLEAELREDAVEKRRLAMPAGLSVTQVQALNKDEDEFISRLLRPMPLPPAPAAAQGTAFHAWVEARARQQFGVGAFAVLSGQEDYDKELSITLDTATLKKFQSNFESCEWANKIPAAVEHPFTIIVGGRQIRGKIDAVFQDGDDWIVVDWKTNEKATADDLQLSIYRHAWAEAQGVSPERVKAAFYYVAFNETHYAQSLMTREQISQLLNA